MTHTPHLQPETGETDVRIDKWLWAVRLFKTRSMATKACSAGHVRIDDQRVKPSRSIRVGDILDITDELRIRKVRVKALLANRVGAPMVQEYREDLDCKPAAPDAGLDGLPPAANRIRGSGRPTKRERRRLDRFLGW